MGLDILRLRVQSNTYDLHFVPFSISNGSVLIVDVKKSASRKLNADPRRLSLSYKGRDLSHDYGTAKEYGLKHHSEVVCVIVDELAQDAAHGDLVDLVVSERNRRKNDANLAFQSLTQNPSKEDQQTAGVPSPGWPGMSWTASRRKPAAFDPNTPGGDEPMASRISAYAYAQPQYTQYYPDRLPSSKTPVRGSSTKTLDAGHHVSSRTRDAFPGLMIVDDEDAFPTTDSQGSVAGQVNKGRSSTVLSGDSETGGKSVFNPASSRYAMVGHEKAFSGESSRILRLRNVFQKQLQRQHDGLTAETISEQDKTVRELQAMNDQSDVPSVSDVARPKVGDQLLPPAEPARSRSAPVTHFHSIVAKAFEEDIFVWSSTTRDLTPTMASVDTQSDRNLVYVGFLENDLRLEYKKYEDGGATPLRTLAGSVWPLGWVMLKIFPFKVNRKSGVKERHRPQHVVFDVYETSTFGDMVSYPYDNFNNYWCSSHLMLTQSVLFTHRSPTYILAHLHLLRHLVLLCRERLL